MRTPGFGTRAARHSSRASAELRPRVVLLDLGSWDSFASFAAAARAHGLDVVRVSTRHQDPAGPLRSLLDDLVFGRGARHLELDPGALLDQDLNGLLEPPTVDLQGPEDVVAALRSRHAMTSSIALARLTDEELVPVLYDKLAMTRLAESLDIPVPASRTVLGPPRYPLVVKRSIGSGGQAVRVVRGEHELSEALAELGTEDMNPVFFQDFQAGEVINYGGVARDGRLLAGCAYEALRAPGDPLGPAVGLEVVEDGRLEDDVVRLLAALSYTGFFCIDYIRPAAGPALLIDFNPRVFGSWLGLELAGAGLLPAYLSLLGFGPEPPRSRVAPGIKQRVSLRPRRHVEGYRAAVVDGFDTVRTIWRAAPTTGMSFVLAFTLRAGLRVARAVLRRRPRSRTSAPSSNDPG